MCMNWVLEKLLIALAENKNREGGREGGRMREEEDSKTKQRKR